MARSKRPARPLEETIDVFGGLCDEPMLVLRGHLYATYRRAGFSDLVAATASFRTPAIDAAPNTTVAQLADYFRTTCGWEFPGDLAEAA